MICALLQVQSKTQTEYLGGRNSVSGGEAVILNDKVRVAWKQETLG